MLDNISLDQIRTSDSHNLVTLFEQCETDIESFDSPFQYGNDTCDYYEPEQFHQLTKQFHETQNYFHLNCRGLSANWNSFRELICDLHGNSFSFDLIGISEAFRCDQDARLSLPGFHDLLTRCRDDGSRGGVGLFIKDNINFKIREDLSVFIPHVFESVFIEMGSKSEKHKIIGVIYRPNTAPKADMDIFSVTLHDILDTINRENKLGVIMGDFNIDLLKFMSHSKTSDYLDNVFSHGFIPTISKPTRVTNASATLIDHIYTNDIISSATSGIIITDVADHFGTFHSVSHKHTHISSEIKQTRFYSDKNILKFKTLLDQTDFRNILQINCPNEAFDVFILKYRNAFEQAFPLRAIKANKKFIKREPWVTSGLLTSSRTRAKLLAKKLSNPTENNIQTFSSYNNLFNKTKRTIKANYYHAIIEEHKFSIKQTWKILKDLIGRKNDKSNFPQEFLIKGESVTDKSTIAESFNDYFSRIGLETGQNVPVTDAKYIDFLPDPFPRSIFIDPVAPSDITNTVRKLKSKSSFGHDEISTKLLKETINNIAIPITYILNRSFSIGIVPDKMKIAKVVPVFKSSDRCSIKNYRPISLLTSFSKLLEKVMYDKIMCFLNTNNILYKHQYGFRAKHSTIHPIIHLLNYCADAANKNDPEYTLAVFCDLSKAFDVINHKILLHKLRTYGIRGIVNDWFSSYLSNRIQFVEIEGNTSSHQLIHCGVPQGSILGPLLYLIYVNDIHKSCESNILSFADDTTLYISHSNLTDLFHVANTEINNLYKWFCANKLSLNAKKTKYIVIRPKYRQCSFENKNVFINGTPLQRVGQNCTDTSVKFLGLCIDEYLTWQHHIKHVNSKISRTMFAIKQVKNILPAYILRNLYFALIHPHLCYGILAWGNASQPLRKTITLQKRAIRTINKAAYNSHTDPLFHSSQVLKLQDLYTYQSALFMFDYVNNNLPASFTNVFSFNRDIQTTRQTRQSDLLYIPRCKTNFSSKLPLYTLPRTWNNWANSESFSRLQFKKHVKLTLVLGYSTHVKCSNAYCMDCR